MGSSGSDSGSVDVSDMRSGSGEPEALVLLVIQSHSEMSGETVGPTGLPLPSSVPSEMMVAANPASDSGSDSGSDSAGLTGLPPSTFS